METITEIAMVRENRMNKQKTITIPKKIKKIKKDDRVEFIEDKNGVRIRKID